MAHMALARVRKELLKPMPSIAARSSRWCHTAASSNEPQEPAWVARLNATLRDYPGPSFVTYLGTSLATFGVANVVLSTMQFDFPALAVGGIVSKLTKKPRMPIDFSLATALSHAAPWTNMLKLGPLLTSPMPAEAPAATAPTPTMLESRVIAFTKWVEGPVNQYGAPYMLVHWFNGMATCVGTALCVHYGVDVIAALKHLPFVSSSSGTAEFVSVKASCVAGAALLNSLSLPLRIYLMSVLARPAFVASYGLLDCTARRYRSHLREQLRTSRDFPRRLALRSRL